MYSEASEYNIVTIGNMEIKHKAVILWSELVPEIITEYFKEIITEYFKYVSEINDTIDW